MAAPKFTLETEKAILHLAAVIKGRRGGSMKGKNKRASSARNGKLGGRPRNAL